MTGGNMGEKSLSELTAIESIRRLLSLYSDAVQRREPDEIAGLFAADAEVVIMDGAPRIGREAIVAGLKQTMSGFQYLHQTFGPGLIDVAGNAAKGRISIMEITRPIDGETLNAVFGQYEDDYVRIGGTWQFHRRRFFLSYMAKVPASEAAPFAALTPLHQYLP
jgi:hypothetical protein